MSASSRRWFLLLALVAVPAAAQDLEVFRQETFLDPSSLTVPGDDGRPLDLTFLAAYLRTGFAQSFQYQSQFLKSRIGFVDLTGTLVHRRLQITGRWTGYDLG